MLPFAAAADVHSSPSKTTTTTILNDGVVELPTFQPAHILFSMVFHAIIMRSLFSYARC